MSDESAATNPTLTLSVGGVSFCLYPDGGHGGGGTDGGAVQFQQEGSEVLLNLQSFTGTLRVAQVVRNVTPKHSNSSQAHKRKLMQNSEEASKKVREALADTDDASVATNAMETTIEDDRCMAAKAATLGAETNQPGSLPPSSYGCGSTTSPAPSQSTQQQLQEEASQDPTLLGQTQQSQLSDTEDPMLDDYGDEDMEEEEEEEKNTYDHQEDESQHEGEDSLVEAEADADKPARVSLGEEKQKQEQQQNDESVAELVDARSATAITAFKKSTASLNAKKASSTSTTKEAPARVSIPAVSSTTKEAPARVSIPAVSSRGPTMLSAPAMSTKHQDPPCARWAHTLTDIGKGRLLVYGGQTIDPKTGPTTLDDVHIYDTEKQLWFKPFNCNGSPRQWHTATYLPERQLLISFGGETVTKGKVTSESKVMVLDTEIMLWYPPTVTGDIPSSRSGHTATVLDRNLVVVFGGVKGRKWLNTVNVLDCTVWKWSAIKALGSAPPPRSYHTAVALGDNRILIMGGNNADKCFDSIHVLEKSTVYNEEDGTTTIHWRWSHPSATGEIPTARTGHSATVLSDGTTVMIYGGWDPNGDDDDEEAMDENDEEIIFDDYYLLDTDKWKWRKGGVASSKRVGHGAVLMENTVSDNEVRFFGGRIPGDSFCGDFEVLKIE